MALRSSRLSKFYFKFLSQIVIYPVALTERAVSCAGGRQPNEPINHIKMRRLSYVSVYDLVYTVAKGLYTPLRDI
jgi:hypothetical protein